MPCAPRLNADQYQSALEKLERARSGDAAAREELVQENLPLVHFVLRRFRDRRAEYDDLFQYGCIGLLKAIDRFDPDYGARFSTYAVPIILGEVRRYLRDDAPVHISRTIHDHAVQVERFRADFFQRNGREPEIAQICAELEISREDVLLALNANQRVRSLQEPAAGDGDLRLMDTLGEESMAGVDSRLMLAQLLRQLQPEERAIIIRRYFHAHTQTAIARDMGISQVQVSRMESKILKRMRLQAEG